MDDARGTSRRSLAAGVVTLTVVLVILGLRPVRLSVVEHLPLLALLDGIQLPTPLPTLGLPLFADPSWLHWTAQVAGALVIPVVFALRFARSDNGERVALRSWWATVQAVPIGCLITALLTGMLLPGGIVSELLLILGTLLIGAIVGALLGVLVAVVCVVGARRPRPHDRTPPAVEFVPVRLPGTRWTTGLLVGVVIAGLALSGIRSATATQHVPAITDVHGNSLVLRGFSTDGGAKGPSGLPDIAPAGIDQESADMGTNFVRFLITWQSVEPQPGIYDEAYLDEVATRVKWYGDRGYHVMLDMHQDLYSAVIVPGTADGAPAWATHTDGLPVGRHDMWERYYLDPAVMRAFDNFWNTTGRYTTTDLRSHYVNAWRAVAKRFADNPTVVAYDLMNEPYGGSLQGPAFEAGPLTQLYQATTDAIRTVDGSTWVCLEPQAIGVNWGTPTGLGRVDDPRNGPPHIALCPHLYPLPLDLGGGYVGTTRSFVDSAVDTWLENTLRASEKLGGVPVILGEFGLDTTLPGALDYVRTVYSKAGEHGFGLAYWSRDAGTWGPYDKAGNRRNLVDALDQPYPRSVSGSVGAIRSQAHILEFDVRPVGNRTATIYLSRGFSPDLQRPGVAVTGAKVTTWDARHRLLTVVIDPGASKVMFRAG